MEVGCFVMNTAILYFIFGFSIYEIQCNIQKSKTNHDFDKQIESNFSSNFGNANHFVRRTFSKVNDTNCRLFIQKDLPKPNEPQPLYINPKTNKIWEPNASGYLEIPSGAIIELFCSTSFANATTTTTTTSTSEQTTEVNELFIQKNIKTLKPKCIAGKTFIWQGKKYEFRQFICRKPLNYIVERLDEKCAQQTAEIFRIGFNITENRFIETMRICYDTATMRNHYTQHILLAGNAHFQRNVKRWDFSKAGFFDKHNVNFYYTRKNQWQRALQLYGNNKTVATILNDEDLFLARGHLAAKADFVYANQQRSTFIFLNVAPQWQSFNGGQWAALEDEVRKFVLKQQVEVDCYTGTYGVLKLQPPNNTNVEAQLFHLANDENNNDILPVPQLFFRVIIERKNRKRGIALLGVNNPYATLKEIEESYIICSDIKEQVPWLNWIRNTNLKKGYIYACNVTDFYNAVKILPLQINNATEVLT